MIEFAAIARIHPIHPRRTFALQAFGQFDPTASWKDDCLTKSFMTASGLCTVSLATSEEGLSIRATGRDAERTVQQLVAAAETDDGYHSFAPRHPELEKHCRQLPGLRLIRVPWLFDMACSAILQQRVRSTDAMREWSNLCKRLGSADTHGHIAFPSPATLANVPLHELQALGIDPRRARTLLALAREARFHPLTAEIPCDRLRLVLKQVPGIGPWTLDMILGFGAADPDAVPVGDLYLPHLVTDALAGEPRGTDERMLELLEPFRPQRFRVVRLLYSASIAAPGW